MFAMHNMYAFDVILDSVRTYTNEVLHLLLNLH